MPAKKTSPARKTTTSAATTDAPSSTGVSAAVRGASRRRAARLAAEAPKPTSKSTSKSKSKSKSEPARSSSANRSSRSLVPGRAKAKRAKPGRLGWAKAAARPGNISRDDVRKVLDKGVSKADQLLESAMKWVVKLAIRAKALYDMLSAWWGGRFDLPLGTLQAIVVALMYFLSPLDIIPDFLPLFGLADDAAIFAFVVGKIRGDLEAFAKASGKALSDLGL